MSAALTVFAFQRLWIDSVDGIAAANFGQKQTQDMATTHHQYRDKKLKHRLNSVHSPQRQPTCLATTSDHSEILV